MLKVVLEFSQFNHGWTETWFVPLTDPGSFLNSIPGSTYSKALAFRAPSTYLYGVRASVVNAPKQSSLVLVQVSSPGTPSGADNYSKPDVVSTCLQVRLFSLTGKNRFITLRGLRDGDVLLDPFTGVGQPSATLTSQVLAYIRDWTNRSAAIQSTARPPTVGIVPTRVAQVIPNTFNSNNSDLIVLNDVIPFTDQPLPISILGIPKDDLPGFPSLTTVVAKSTVSGIHYTIPYRYRGQGAITFPPRMTLMAYAPAYNAINFDQTQFYRFSERKTGRPFGSLRGRSRGAVRRQ